MAFESNAALMHQMTVKGKRLTSGLERLVGVLRDFDPGNADAAKVGELRYAYFYALGCLGGDFLKKELFKSEQFEGVVKELVEQKFVKEDRGEKMLAEWREKRSRKSPSAKVDDEPKNAEEERTDTFSFMYDHAEWKTDSSMVPETLKKDFDYIMSAYAVAMRFPESISAEGRPQNVRWMRTKIDDLGGKKYKITYTLVDTAAN